MSFEDRIAGETRAWVADALISEEQAEAIRQRYASDPSLSRRGRLVTVLSLLGALAVGAGAHIPHRIVLLGAATGIAALVAAGALALDRARKTARWEALGVALAAGVLLLGTQVPLSAVTFNVILVVLTLGAIWVGFENDEEWLVNLGIAVAAIELVTRFFDWFWHFLPRSAAFVATGVFLLVLAWVVERQRSRLIARMGAD